MKNVTQKFIGLFALVFSISFTINAQQIGDIYEGGYIFQINEDGTGLVADLQDLGQMNWNDAMDASENNTSGGYDDWRLPTHEELLLMYSTIGPGGNNDAGLYLHFYWSSSSPNPTGAWYALFTDGYSDVGGVSASYMARAIRSVTFGEDESDEWALELPSGWSMFGYYCTDSADPIVAFSEIADKIEIVKDEWGLSYIPSWEFNAMGSLQFSEGYQIKMIEEVDDFQFCDLIVPEDGIGQADVDAAYDAGAASVTPEDGIGQADVDAAYDAGAASVTPEDGVSQADVDAAAAAAFDEGAASVTPEDGIGQDDVDAAYNGGYSDGAASVTPEDGISQDYVDAAVAAVEASYLSYINASSIVLQIGDQLAGGIIFQINEDGTGLVADLQDLGEMNWYDAMGAAESYSSQGYDDWYLPSKDELHLIYTTIGQGGPEGNFEDLRYWSSSEFNYNSAWDVSFINGTTIPSFKSDTYRVRVIRAF